MNMEYIGQHIFYHIFVNPHDQNYNEKYLNDPYHYFLGDHIGQLFNHIFVNYCHHMNHDQNDNDHHHRHDNNHDHNHHIGEYIGQLFNHIFVKYHIIT